MAKIYDRTDLLWTAQGDFYIGNEGDLADTLHDPLRSFSQEIRTRIMSDQGAWVPEPQLGADVSDFVGKANNKVSAEGIKARIIGSLTRDNLVHPNDLKVVYAPVDPNRIMFRISIQVASTPRNAGSSILGMSLVYDYTENNVLFH